MPFSPAQNEQDVFLLASVSFRDVSSATAHVFTFRVPIGCTILALEMAVDTEGNADNVHLAELRTGTTVLFSTGPTAPDTVSRDTTVATGQSADRDAGETLNINVAAPTGTTAGSSGIYVAVWARRRPV